MQEKAVTINQMSADVFKGSGKIKVSFAFLNYFKLNIFKLNNFLYSLC